MDALIMTPSKTPVLTHRASFLIRSYEIDPHKQATPTALVRLMQEASMQHVLQLQLSVWDLEPQGISWVLIRQHLHIKRLPLLGETVEVFTHPSGFERVFTHRDFRMYDAGGNEIANASTTWLLMHTDSRRMARIPADLLAYNDLLPHPSGNLPRAADKLPEFEHAISSRAFKVGWYDLDFNFHLTNSKYVEWMLESAEESLLKNASLQEMDVLYLSECLHGDEVTGETCIIDKDTRLHRLVRQSDGKELARGRTRWLMANG